MSDTQTDADGDGHRYDPSADHSFPDERLNDVLEYLESDEGDTGLSRGPERQSSRPKGYNDHGSKHVSIVRHRALCLYDLLKRGEVTFNGALEQGLDEADEPVIVALAATLHDIGHVVHRDEHPYYSIPLAADLLGRVLPEFYDVADAVESREKCSTLSSVTHAGGPAHARSWRRPRRRRTGHGAGPLSHPVRTGRPGHQHGVEPGYQARLPRTGRRQGSSRRNWDD